MVRTVEEKRERNAWQKYLHYIRTAKVRNLDFELTYEKFRELTSQSCHYCGVMPYAKFHSTFSKNGDLRFSNEAFVYNGIDRVDNKIGYVDTNVVPCCRICNYIKNRFDAEKINSRIEEFVEWSNRIQKFQSGDGKQGSNP